MAVEALESYLGGKWSRGDGAEIELVDPTNGSLLATASASSVDLKAAVAFAREHGGPALRALTYAERARLLGAVADVLAANRARYEEIAIANSGNTKIDAAIDIDGGIGTLKYYARLGAPLGDAKALVDDKPVRLAKAENFQAIHLLVPRRGVAVHINAFNFPSWGLWEKAACALLSGMPMLAKPASATAMLSHQMVRDVVAAKVVPEGALSLLCGGIGDLLDHVGPEDVIAFTGSSETANHIRSHRNVLMGGTLVNVEADSVNAALLAPGIAPATTAFDAFVKEVAREMTVKAGQKCTAIRRVLAPAARANAVADALAARLAKVAVGDPRSEATRMGPLVTRTQQAAALDGISKLASEAELICGGSTAPKLDGIDSAKSAFVAPTLLKVESADKARAVHDTEVFGPAATKRAKADAQNATASEALAP
jgi:3,4-dehydroadipyl-CoA semialdehyde dehydrogenase